MRLNREPKSVAPAKTSKARTKAEQPATPSAELADPFDLQQAVGNRAAATLLHGLHASRHTAWAPDEEPVEKKPEQMAEEELKRGPKSRPKRWAEDLRKSMEQTPDAQPIQVKAVNDRQGVRLLSGASYDARARDAKNFRQEAGVPRAFLDSSNIIGPARIDVEPTTETNLVVQTQASGKNGGEVWVQSAALPWTVNTAGYMDSSRIDPSMLPDYRRHEEGHASIAERVRDRLAPLLQSELNQTLPTAKSPLRLSGKDWVKRGVDIIYEKVDRVIKRYQQLWDELATRADDEWDKQERQTLSRIATMKSFQPGNRGPE